MMASFLALVLIIQKCQYSESLEVINYENFKEEEISVYETRIQAQLAAKKWDFQSLLKLFSQRRALELCNKSRKQIIYLCRSILQNKAYNLQLSYDYYEDTECTKINFDYQTIENLHPEMQYFQMVTCPPVHKSELKYFLSSTDKEDIPSLNVFRQKGMLGFKVRPSGYVFGINMEDLRQVFEIEKKSVKRPFRKLMVVDERDPLLVPETIKK